MAKQKEGRMVALYFGEHLDFGGSMLVAERGVTFLKHACR